MWRGVVVAGILCGVGCVQDVCEHKSLFGSKE